MAMEKREGVPYAEGIKKVWMKDSRGLIVKESRINYIMRPMALTTEPKSQNLLQQNETKVISI